MRLLLSVTYHGRRLAIAGRRRAWFTRAVEQLPDDHPERRIAAALCLYARDRLRAREPYDARQGEAFAAHLLIAPEDYQRQQAWLAARGAPWPGQEVLLAALLGVPASLLQTYEQTRPDAIKTR